MDAFPGTASSGYYDPYRKLRAVKISPGEYCVVKSHSLLVTVLGSCITACLYDIATGVGGMNQFLVANIHEDLPLNQRMVNIANAAMDKFIRHLVDSGASVERLKAKVFGGGHILNSLKRDNVGARSTRFLNEYLMDRKIPILAADVLDIYPRKIYFFPQTGEVLVKKLKDMKNETLLERERRYADRLLGGMLS